MSPRSAAAARYEDLVRLRRVREPTDQPYGVRDCALRDPAGNLTRLQERR